jgi:uncharacterized protein YdaU (DUF1376 family)
MTGFNAQAARTKRPLPLWVDAFQRDTQHLSADEIGVYFMLLMAMWSRESCDLDDDDNRLALVCKVTPTIWRRRYSSLMRGFFQTDSGKFFSKRLKKEARIVEQFCANQSGRKKKEKEEECEENQHGEVSGDDPRKPCGSTADISGDDPTYNLQPTRRKKEEEDARAREVQSDLQEGSEPGVSPTPQPPPVPRGVLADIRQAVGIQPHTAGPYWSDPTLAEHVEAWRSYGLSDDQIIAEAEASRKKNPDPPDGPKALDRWMEAAGKARQNAPAKGQAGRAKAEVKPPPSPAERLKYFADLVNSDKYVAPSTITNTLAHSLLDAGLVTKEKLRERGIAA